MNSFYIVLPRQLMDFPSLSCGARHIGLLTIILNGVKFQRDGSPGPVGSGAFWISDLRMRSGMSYKQLWESIDLMESDKILTSNIQHKSTNKIIHISICNWESYIYRMDGHQRAEISQSNEPSTSHQRAINDNVLMKEGENGTNPLRPLTGTLLGKSRTPYSIAGDSGVAEHLLPGTLKHLVRPDLEIIKKLKSRLSALFSRKETSAWEEKELTVLHRISRRPGVLDEMTLLEKAHASGWTWHRQDIPTTLNNWTGELDRARQILNNPNKANIDTKTCVQPNANNTAVYWDRNLARHTSLGRKPEDFQICGFKTQSDLLDRMAVRLDLIWKQAVGDVMWNSKASERPERMEFYRVQADQFLGFINTVKEYRGDFRSNMHENPFTVLDKLAPFLLDKWGDAKWDARPYRTVRCYSDKWWAEFVTYLEDHWQVNFTSGTKKSLH